MGHNKLPPESVSVKDWLEKRGFTPQIKLLDTMAHTAAEAASALDCELGQIAKSLVFYQVQSNQPVLIIVSGANRVDKQLVGDYLGTKIKTAGLEYVLETTGFPVGGVPPVAHKSHLRTLLDRDLLAFRQVWAAAGHSLTLFPIPPDQLIRLTRAEAIAVA
ncbi:MAG: hypothetical protein UX91_C0001G0038 [Candidatus Amesbacteria bacterium GW2011_GWB1_47_19]|nr:MAG: hypothetical protein UW51_C0001G0038 [Candidatus Amesbacteria bacterium GW2011_GWA1_44_24]KKU32050.1 MAG: hypothetical protein UX46_C0001G0037 [Candidatus Amesbacteria bacterium GW2011_GWC1_46_24]KKU67734.1 MAG: hypothetical protein UX91_C0001G0038 [Candidatus Amesbacteria bacterium GW2011_GWB1_47_19]OGD06081.1 MAG: hypothetical protein A2379_03235 [Candidatus Amesbacteria bacterium RIFOXYB1_FULL_47_13]HBC72329.1 hypothetical protein [Candidatus Amesbacteria bacterium]